MGNRPWLHIVKGGERKGKKRDSGEWGKRWYICSAMSIFKLKKSLQPRVKLSWPSSESNVPPTGVHTWTRESGGIAWATVVLLEAGEDELKYAWTKKLLAGLPQKQNVKTYFLFSNMYKLWCTALFIFFCRICLT